MTCKYDHLAGRTPDNRCIECRRLDRLKYRTQNAERISMRKAKHRIDNLNVYRERDARRDVAVRRRTVIKSHRKTRALRRATVLLRIARRRATQKGVPYDLDAHLLHYQSVIDEGVCQETGLPFDMASHRGPFTPSLDRVKPELGYVHDNVRVVLWGLNAGFADFGHEIYAKIASAFLRRNPWLVS